MENYIPVVINSAHKLFDDQVNELDKVFGQGSWKEFKLPVKGMNFEKVTETANELKKKFRTVVFASQFGALMVKTAVSENGEPTPSIYAFFSEERKTVEKDGVAITNYNEMTWELKKLK